MEKNSTATPEASLFDGTAWFDPIEAGVRDRIRGFIESMLEEDLTTALGRERYRRVANCSDAVLVAARIGPDHHAQNRPVAEPRRASRLKCLDLVA